jgi:cellulose biosynthesis protein BcsQ
MVIDTGQGATDEDLEAAAEASDFLVIPLTPEFLDKDGQAQMLGQLQQIVAKNYRVLITRVAPYKGKEVLLLRSDLAEIDAPVFKVEIPRLEVFDKAAGRGGTVETVSGDKNAARAWQAYVDAGKELIQ